MSVGADVRRFVGRWAIKGSEDGYVLSASRVVENCQRLASVHARAAAGGGPDFFGEEETLAQLRNCLGAQGVEEERISAQIQRLTRARACLPPDVLGSISSGGVLNMQAAPSHQESGSSMAGLAPLQDVRPEDVVVEPFPVRGEFEVEDSGGEGAMNLNLLADLLVEEKKPESPTGFVVSIT